MMNDFINYAETLSIEEIDSFISKLTQIKEERADVARHAAAQKVIDAIADYLKLGEEISIEGKVWNEDWDTYENFVTTLNDCFEENGHLTITLTE